MDEMKTHIIQIKYNMKRDSYANNSETNMMDVISKDCKRNPSQMYMNITTHNNLGLY